LLNITEGDTVSLTAAQEEQELRDAFRVFDKHNRGYITASDLTFVLKCLGENLDEEESNEIIYFFLSHIEYFFLSPPASH
jgi:Ca2+-binding EF-hand superfamily protein